MKIRITGKNLPKAQFAGGVGGPYDFINLLPGSPIMNFFSRDEPTNNDVIASLVDPTGVANIPFFNAALKDVKEEPTSIGNWLGLTMEGLGMIPLVGEAADVARTPARMAQASKISKAEKVGKKIFKPVAKVAKVATKAMELPANIVNRGFKLMEIPYNRNVLNTANRGLRAWGLGYHKGIEGLDYLFPGTPSEKKMGGQSNNMKIIITGKGLVKAQYQNSEVVEDSTFPTYGSLQFPTFQQSAKQIMTGQCPSGYQKNPFTNQCEPKPNFGTTSSPQVESNLGEGFIKNPITGTYGKPAQPSYTGGITYKGTPSKTKPKNRFANTMANIGNYMDLGFTVGQIGSNIYSNFLQGQNKQINRKQHLEGLPDWQVPGEMYRGMWTTNQGRQSPIDQYTPNLGQTTGNFYPQLNYGKDGLQVPEHVGDVYVEAPYPMMSPVPDISSITGSREMPSSYSSGNLSNVSLEGTDVATRNNNPGNMLYQPWMKKFGAVPSSNKATDSGKEFAQFPNITNGMEAYKLQLFGDVDGKFKSKYYKANTPVDEALKKWSNGGYGEEIYPEITGKTLGELTQSERNELIKRQIKHESGSMYKQLSEADIFDMGGEANITNTNGMKIRITDIPRNTQAKEMAYGGQLGYGFDLGQRNTYSKMNQNPYQKTSSTLQPVPRNEANIEAEKGETAYGDLDGDGQKEHMKIGGQRHSNGGTPLNVNPGSFIFSDTAKMRIKDPEVLKFFGLGSKKGGYTPAEIAKRYDINKYKGILQDPYADAINKQTAKRMIDSYEQKLGYLALIQESMKGFPQGIPEVAENVMGGKMPQDAQQASPKPNGVQEYPEGQEPEEGQPEEQAQEQYMEEPQMRWGGGLHKYQTDGQVKEKKIKVGDKEVTATFIDPNTPIPQGYNQVTGVPDLWQKPGTPGTSGSIDLQQAPGGTRGDEDKYWRDFLIPQLEKGVTPEQLVEKGYMHGANIDKARQYYKPIPGTEATDDSYLYTERPEDVVVTPPPADTPAEPAKPKGPKGEVPPVPNVPFAGQNIPFGWDVRDNAGLLNSLINYSTVKKDLFDYSKIAPFIPRTAMDEWLSKAQEKQQTYRTAAETMGQAMPGQGLAANLSMMAGKTGEGVSQDITGVNQANIARFVENEKEKANILNNAMAYNAAVADKNRELRFNVNRQYRTDERLARNAKLQAWMQGRTNAVNTYNLNMAESPFYTYNYRTGLMQFNSPAARAAFENMRRRGYTGNNDYAANPVSQYSSLYNQFYDTAKGSDAEKAAAAQIFLKGYLGDKIPAGYTPPSGGIQRSAYGGQQAAYGYAYNNPFLI